MLIMRPPSFKILQDCAAFPANFHNFQVRAQQAIYRMIYLGRVIHPQRLKLPNPGPFFGHLIAPCSSGIAAHVNAEALKN